jgi:transposase
MDTEAMPLRYVGIDVGKDRIEVHIRPDAVAFGCDTDAKSLDQLVTRLKPLKPKVIALEATGGYEAIIAATLSNAGLPVAIVRLMFLETGSEREFRRRPARNGA